MDALEAGVGAKAAAEPRSAERRVVFIMVKGCFYVVLYEFGVQATSKASWCAKSLRKLARNEQQQSRLRLLNFNAV